MITNIVILLLILSDLGQWEYLRDSRFLFLVLLSNKINQEILEEREHQEESEPTY